MYLVRSLIVLKANFRDNPPYFMSHHTGSCEANTSDASTPRPSNPNEARLNFQALDSLVDCYLQIELPST